MKERRYIAETIVHDHTTNDSGVGIGIILAVLLFLIFAFLIFFGLPIVRSLSIGTTPQINVPNQIDVNVHGVQGGGK